MCNFNHFASVFCVLNLGTFTGQTWRFLVRCSLHITPSREWHWRNLGGEGEGGSWGFRKINEGRGLMQLLWAPAQARHTKEGGCGYWMSVIPVPVHPCRINSGEWSGPNDSIIFRIWEETEALGANPQSQRECARADSTRDQVWRQRSSCEAAARLDATAPHASCMYVAKQSIKKGLLVGMWDTINYRCTGK